MNGVRPPRRALRYAALAALGGIGLVAVVDPRWLAVDVVLSRADRVVLPVSGVASDELQDTFGGRRPEARQHEGLDLHAPRGRPVVAAWDGMVWSIEETPRGGRVVWVLGSGFSMHYYAHLDAFRVDLEPGRRVRAGEPLGTVGSTGNAENVAPHLHFSVEAWSGLGRAARNPYPLLVSAEPSDAPSPLQLKLKARAVAPTAPETYARRLEILGLIDTLRGQRQDARRAFFSSIAPRVRAIALQDVSADSVGEDAA